MSDIHHASLSSIKIKDVLVKNRLCFAAMGIDLALPDGSLSSDMVSFYRGIIDGGVGTLILPNASVTSSSRLNPKGLGMYTQQHGEALERFLAQTKDKGVLVGVQLQHYGGQGISINGEALLTPSGRPCKLRQSKDSNYYAKEMTLGDIKDVINQFVEGAVFAFEAGAKYIQLQASNGYLLSSFMSPYTNYREDEYGGSPVKRAKILIEIIEQIRKRTSESLIIGVRIGIDDMVGDIGQKVGLLKEVIPLLEKAGVDVFEASMCIGETFHYFLRPNEEFLKESKSKLTEFKSYCSLPVIYSGFIGSVSLADDFISENIVDVVGMTRALFADNDLIIKTQMGKMDQINTCLWDGNCFRDKSNKSLDRVYCCVNPKYKRPSGIQYK